MDRNFINFDHIGNPPQCPKVTKHLSNHALACGNPNSGHDFGMEAKLRYNTALQDILDKFPGFNGIELIPGGGTNANKRSILGTINLYPSKKTKKDVILISQLEHKSINTYITQYLSHHGYYVIKIPSTSNGVIATREYESLLKEYGDRIALISVLSVNNEIGTIQPIEELYRKAKGVNASIIFHSDVCHGLLLPSVNTPDIVSFSAYKLGGIHSGIVLYKKPYISLAEDYFGTPDVIAAETTSIAVLEAFKATSHSLLSFKKNLSDGVEHIFTKHSIPYVNLSPVGESTNNVLSFITCYLDGDVVMRHLSKHYGIMISAGSACMTTSGSRIGSIGSHVVKSMGYSNKSTFNLIRYVAVFACTR